ncbi:MAG: hypothetical protein K2K90_17930 [Lachnospiraceae bacterium]|nr:hypothetical protein [Lachnospiraceae bacterium]
MKKIGGGLLVGSVIVISFTGIWKIIVKAGTTIAEKNKLVDKYKLYFCLNNKWISLKESNKRLSRYFVENQIKSIAVYGLGDVGLNLCDEIMKDGIEVKYAFDGNLIRYESLIPIKRLEDEVEEVDAVVVTIPDEFEAIKNNIGVKFSCPIISIDDIVYSV